MSFLFDYMSKARLKKLRTKFRNDVFERDEYKCVFCFEKAEDAHHITDRNLMPNGGYVAENGVSLCATCHLKAESFHKSNGAFWFKGFRPVDIYKKIGSSYEEAYAACESLNEK